MSILLHLILVGLAMIGYYSYVEPVEAPIIPVSLLEEVPPPPPPPAARRKTSPVAGEPEKPQFQPTEIPEKMEDPVEEDPPAEGQGEGAGFEGGVEGGLPGGVEGEGLMGIPTGLLDSLPSGLIASGDSAFGEASPLPINGVTTRPVRIKTVKPDYPSTAQKAHIEGLVWLQAIISESGQTENVTIIRSLHPLLDQCAMVAVQQWRYRPALLNRRPVRVIVTLAVKFTIRREVATF